MKFVIVFGPGAVGKMTVGQELAKITDLRLFHNHMTIDLVSNFFSYGTQEGKRLVKLFRQEIFESVAKSDLDGIIFTFIWAFDSKPDWDYLESIISLYKDNDANIYYVELEADYDVRLKRNKTLNRLENKPTKRDLEFSERIFIHTDQNYRCNSFDGELKEKNYIRINNTEIEADIVAKMVKDRFDL